LLAKGGTFRTLIEQGDWIEASGPDRTEARTALQSLGETSFATLNNFAIAQGVTAPGVGSRRSPKSQASMLIVALDDAQFGVLRAVATGEKRRRGADADAAPEKALLATIRAERGGTLDYGGDTYRLAPHVELGRWTSKGYRLVATAEAAGLLSAMASESRADEALKGALDDAGRFLWDPAHPPKRAIVLLRKTRPKLAPAAKPGPAPTTPSASRASAEPTIRLVSVEAAKFVPVAETNTLSYAVDGPVEKAASVTLVITSVPPKGDRAVVGEIPVPGPYAASGTFVWDGRASTPGGTITVKGSPYEIMFELVSTTGKKSTSATGNTAVEVKEIKISVDDTGALDVADPWKKTVDDLIVELKNSGMPGDCEGRVIINSPIFKTGEDQMTTDASFTAYNAAIGAGPTVPLVAQITLTSKTGNGLRCATALSGTRVLWDLKLETSGDLDGSLGARGTHAAAKTFEKKVAGYEETLTKPHGTSAHQAVGGWRAQAPPAGQQWMAGGEWSMTPGTQRPWAAFTTCGDAPDATEDTAVYFSPGRMAGDTHKVRAVVDVQEALDVASEAAPDGAPLASNRIKFVVWRRIPIVAQWQIGASTIPIEVPPLTAEYKKAALLIEAAPGVKPVDIAAQWKAAYQTVYNSYVASGKPFLAKAMEADPQDYPMRFKDFMEYWKLINPDAGFFGVLWERVRNFFGASDEDNYRKQCDKIWFRVLADVGNKIPIPGDGLTAVKFGHNGPHNQPVSDSFFAGVAPAINGLVGPNKAIFFQFTVSGDAKTFIHEVGHTLFLAHAPGHFDPKIGNPDGYQRDAHDKDQVCLMSYASNKKYLCGLCFLKLAGWNYKKVHKDGTLTP
jgi:hypothetical protein